MFDEERLAETDGTMPLGRPELSNGGRNKLNIAVGAERIKDAEREMDRLMRATESEVSSSAYYTGACHALRWVLGETLTGSVGSIIERLKPKQ